VNNISYSWLELPIFCVLLFGAVYLA
jgi:hypothetical protein